MEDIDALDFIYGDEYTEDDISDTIPIDKKTCKNTILTLIYYLNIVDDSSSIIAPLLQKLKIDTDSIKNNMKLLFNAAPQRCLSESHR